MVPRPSSLRALVGVVTGLVLALPTYGAGAAASALTDPTPAPTAGTVPADGPRGDGAAGRAKPARAKAPRRPAEEGYDAPLAISISELTPGVLPRRGPLVVRGSVTNVDLDTWTSINLYPVLNAGAGCTGCPAVMTTSAELELAAATDPDSPVGQRHTDVSDRVARLAPGESATYTLRIPQSLLRTLLPAPQPGVYWFGVHALGASDTTPRDLFADGRARTFLPYVPEESDSVIDTSVVLPLRARIAHDAEGRIAQPKAWERSLSIEGGLAGRLAFGAAAGDAPLTWVVDPALPDAVHALAQGNPPRSVEPVPSEPSPSPSDGATSEASEEPADDDAEDTDREEEAVVRAAGNWLRQAETVLTGDAVATLPYGDPDVAAAAIAFPELYGISRDHPGRVLTQWGVEPSPVVAPPDGYLDRAGIESVEDAATVLLGDQMFPAEAFSVVPTTVGAVGPRTLVVTDTGAARGGPGPDPRLAPVALRQRVLSEAAVRLPVGTSAPGPAPQPLVVTLPSGVQASGAGAFWAGLDVDWLRLTDLDTLLARAEPTEEDVDLDRLAYSDAAELVELDQVVLLEQRRLIESAQVLQSLLGEDYQVGAQLLEEALTGASYSVRSDRRAARRLARTREWVTEQLEQITLDTPNGVTLSSASGSFGVAVSNDLDHPVTLRLEAFTDDGAEVAIPNPIVLGPNSRSSVTISARMTRPGVHNVALRLTDLDGNPLGAEGEVPIRSAQVSMVIWVIVGVGAGVLFLAIGIRLVRRIRRSRADRAAAGDRPAGAGA